MDRCVWVRYVLQEWGKSGDPAELTPTWHVPDQAELALVTQMLETILVPELEKVKTHIKTENLTR